MSWALATLKVASVRHWVTGEPQITNPLKKNLNSNIICVSSYSLAKIKEPLKKNQVHSMFFSNYDSQCPGMIFF